MSGTWARSQIFTKPVETSRPQLSKIYLQIYTRPGPPTLARYLDRPRRRFDPVAPPLFRPIQCRVRRRIEILGR